MWGGASVLRLIGHQIEACELDLGVELLLEVGELISEVAELVGLGLEELLAGCDLGRRVGVARVEVVPQSCLVFLFKLQGLGLLFGDQVVEWVVGWVGHGGKL